MEEQCHEESYTWFLPFRIKERFDCCMDVCSSYKYGSDIGLERLSYQNITIIIKGESETCPISEIAIIILFVLYNLQH